MKFEWKALPVLALATLIPSLASAQYTRTDLVTNSGAGGTVQDFHLINGWGLVSTSTSPFTVSGVNPVTGKQASASSIFIFATLDGTIKGWTPVVDGISATGASTATLAADRSSAGATYTGLAIATNNGQPFLYAADDGQNRRIDVFDSNFKLVESDPEAFVDSKIP